MTRSLWQCDGVVHRAARRSPEVRAQVVQGLLDEGVVRREQACTDRAALTLLLLQGVCTRAAALHHRMERRLQGRAGEECRAAVTAGREASSGGAVCGAARGVGGGAAGCAHAGVPALAARLQVQGGQGEAAGRPLAAPARFPSSYFPPCHEWCHEAQAEPTP